MRPLDELGFLGGRGLTVVPTPPPVPIRFAGTKSLRPIEELIGCSRQTIVTMWKTSSRSSVHEDTALYPIAAQVTGLRKISPGGIRPNLCLDLHSIILASWRRSDPVWFDVGALWVSENEPRLRELRVKDFRLAGRSIRETFQRDSTDVSRIRLAISLIESETSAGSLGSTGTVDITDRGWEAWREPYRGTPKPKTLLAPTLTDHEKPATFNALPQSFWRAPRWRIAYLPATKKLLATGEDYVGLATNQKLVTGGAFGDPESLFAGDSGFRGRRSGTG